MKKRIPVSSDALARARPMFEASLNKPLALLETQREHFISLMANTVFYEIEIDPDEPVPDSVEMYGDLAVIQFSGSVVSNAESWAERYFGLVNPQRFARDLRETVDNSSVSEILLYVDSYGGTVEGTPEAYEAVVYAVESGKLKTAYAANAASAGYWVLSSVPNIIASSVGAFGSIGVIAGLVDTSKFYESLGVEYNWVRSGNKKALGQSGEEVTEEAIADVKKDIDAIYDIFWGNVTSHRTLSEGLSSGVAYVGVEAINHGLVDSLGSFQTILDEKIQSQNSETKGLFSMTFEEYQAAHPEQAKAALDSAGKAEFDKGVAQGTALVEAQNKDAKAQAESNERVTELEDTVRTQSAELAALKAEKEAEQKAKEEATVLAGIDAHWTAEVPAWMYPEALKASEQSDKDAAYAIAKADGIEAAKTHINQKVSDAKVRFAQTKVDAAKEEPAEDVTNENFDILAGGRDDGVVAVASEDSAFADLSSIRLESN